MEGPEGDAAIAGGVTAAVGFLRLRDRGWDQERERPARPGLYLRRPALAVGGDPDDQPLCSRAGETCQGAAATGRAVAGGPRQQRQRQRRHGSGGRSARPKVAAAVAKVLELPAGRVLVSSTGIIGRPLPADRIVRAVPEAVRTLAAAGGGLAAQAIMTTDTFVKEAALETADRRPAGADRRHVQGGRDDPPEHGHDARLHHHRRRGPPGAAAAAAGAAVERTSTASTSTANRARTTPCCSWPAGPPGRASRPRAPTASASPPPSTRSAAGWPS